MPRSNSGIAATVGIWEPTASAPASLAGLSEIVDANTDIVLSNNLGKSADLIITDKLKSFFNSYGYKVKINTPFTGGFITKYYGKPMNNIHVIQIEINKKVYLSEKNLTIKNNNFNKLKNCFSDIINYINLNNIKL